MQITAYFASYRKHIICKMCKLDIVLCIYLFSLKTRSLQHIKIFRTIGPDIFAFTFSSEDVNFTKQISGFV